MTDLLPDGPLLDAVAESMKKAGVVWVGPVGGPHQVTWLLWHEGAVVLEGPLPDVVEVVVPAPSTGERLTAFVADAVPVTGEQRDALLPLVRDKRLNRPSGVGELVRLAARGPLPS